MIGKQPKPDWSPLPRPGCENVEFRVLLASDGLAIANLRFQSKATIDRHDAAFDIDVICVSGLGFTSIDDKVSSLSAGETVRWSKGREHCLWTDGEPMETIMVERHGG